MEIKKKKKHLQRLEESSQNVRHVENVAAEKVRRKSFFFFKSRNYCKQLKANKTNNLEEMDNYLERYNLPRLNQEEIDNMNRQITSNEIETVIQNLPTNRSPGPNGFTGKFYQTFKEELLLLLLLSCFSRVRLFATP